MRELYLLTLAFCCLSTLGFSAQADPESQNVTWSINGEHPPAEGIEAESAESRFSLQVKTKVNQALLHDSNITQLPDGQVQVSDKSGASAVTGLNLKLQKETKSKDPATNLQLSLGQTRYLDSVFANRNAQNVNVLWEKPFKGSQTTPWMSWSIKVGQRLDFLYAFGPKELAFSTTTPGVMGVVKPVQKKTKFMDVLVPIVGLDFEFRDYKDGYSKDALTENKDTLTPSFTGILMTLKQHQSFKSRTMLLTNIRQGFADSKESEYLNMRFGLSWTASLKHFDITPDVVWALRRQDNYQGSQRNDDLYEGGLAGNFRFNKERSELKLFARYSEQKSNLTAFEYQNTKFGFSATHQF